MENGFSTTPVSRITLFCRDLDQSLELYRDILGFKEIEKKTIQSKEFNELMNDLLPGTKAGDKIHLIILKAQDPVVGMIGLLKPIDPEEEFPAVEFDFKYGSSVFVVGVDDVEELYEKALKFGAKMRAPLSETIYPGADGNDVHVKSLGLYDPDGHFMECNQRL